MTTKSAKQIEALIQWHNDPSTHGLIPRTVDSEIELEVYKANAPTEAEADA